MIWKTGRDQLQVRNRFGWEAFRDAREAFPLSLADYWEWGITDLAGNGARAAMAEFLVARGLGTLAYAGPGPGYDLATRSGLKLTIATASCSRTWPAERRAAVLYPIAPTLAYDAARRQLARLWTRPADIYVLALLSLEANGTANPTDTGAWTFHAVGARALDALEQASPAIAHGTVESRCQAGVPHWRGPVLYRNLRVEIEGLGIALGG